MSDTWYRSVAANEPLTQGDFILNCPVSKWSLDSDDYFDGKNLDNLKAKLDAFCIDAIVMSQACDLEQNKVRDVILCPILPLAEFRELWNEQRKIEGKGNSASNFKGYFTDIKKAKISNLAVLNEGSAGGISTTHRIVDFAEIYSVPRVFLETSISRRGFARLTLVAPYREHLSQSFARFFMRVGLPTPVAEPIIE